MTAVNPLSPSMRLEAALEGHCSTTEGVLQTLDRAMVAYVGGVLLVITHQTLKLVFADIEGASKIERDIRRVVGSTLAVFV